jgi:hypothetical protein
LARKSAAANGGIHEDARSATFWPATENVHEPVNELGRKVTFQKHFELTNGIAFALKYLSIVVRFCIKSSVGKIRP